MTRRAVLAAAVVLACLSAGFAPLLLIEFVGVPIVVALVAAELDREGGWLAVRVISLATLLLPEISRREHEDEWIDHVLASGEEGLRPLLTALTIALLAAPSVAVAERVPAGIREEPLGSLAQHLRRLWAVDLFPSFLDLELVTEIQLLRMLDVELIELQHAVRRAHRKGQQIPSSLVFALASNKLSYRMHELRGRHVRRRHPLLRIAGRLKFHLARLRRERGAECY
jgi:hypothetical protein